MSAPPSPPRAPTLARHLREGWRGQVGWSLGLIGVIALYLPLFPTMQSADLTDLIETLPADFVGALGFDDIANGAGYVQASFFGLLGFALAAIAGISWGTAYVAGAEESGRLEMVLAHGVGRRQYTLESAAALAVKMAALAAVVFVVILALNAPAELGLNAAHLGAGVVAWSSLAAVTGLASLAAGALTGSRSWATAAGAGLAVHAYALDAVGATNEEVAWLAQLSPYHWAFGSSPLASGADWAGLGLLWGLSAALIAVATGALRRRDILG